MQTEEDQKENNLESGCKLKVLAKKAPIIIVLDPPPVPNGTFGRAPCDASLRFASLVGMTSSSGFLERKRRATVYSRPTRVCLAKEAGNYGVGLCGSHSRVNRQNINEKLTKL
jgi:hypothetical protein